METNLDPMEDRTSRRFEVMVAKDANGEWDEMEERRRWSRKKGKEE
jgi:hypothetical protein